MKLKVYNGMWYAEYSNVKFCEFISDIDGMRWIFLSPRYHLTDISRLSVAPPKHINHRSTQNVQYYMDIVAQLLLSWCMVDLKNYIQRKAGTNAVKDRS